LKKIKVTRKAHQKAPWYEQPTLLFVAIGLTLVIGGVLMAHLNRGSSDPTTVLGTADGGDSVAVTPETALPEESVEAEHVLRFGSSLPTAESGQLLPPMSTETLTEAAEVRGLFRSARALQPLGRGEGEPGSGKTSVTALFGFAEAGSVAAATAPGTAEGDLWNRLAVSPEQRPWSDFEIQRDEAGCVYVVAFVSQAVAEEFGVLGASLPLPPAVEEKHPPKWQFWKKRQEPERLVLRQGTEIVLYPDVSPEATCAIVLPFERITPVQVRNVYSGLPRRTEVLDVTLR
jgi:hypothetical protein